MSFDLDAARIAWGGLVLAYATSHDLRTRRVPNVVWVEGIAVAVLLDAWDAYVYHSIALWDAAIAATFGLFAYGVWRARLIGGADAKAFIFLAVLLPSPLELALDGRTIPLAVGLLPSALDVYLYALLAFILVPLGLLARNVVRGDVRFPNLVLGYTMPLDSIKGRAVWLLERPVPGGSTRLRLAATRWEPDEHAKALESLRESGRSHAWVTPKIPFLGLVLVGFLVAVSIGEPWF